SATRIESRRRSLKSSIFIPLSVVTSRCAYFREKERQYNTHDDDPFGKQRVGRRSRFRPGRTSVVNRAFLALLFHQPGDGAHQVVFGENLVAALAQLVEHRWALVAQEVRHPLDWHILGHARKRLAHDLADHQLAEVFALEGKVEDLVFIHGTD